MQNKKTGFFLKKWDYMSLRAKRSNPIRKVLLNEEIATLYSVARNDMGGSSFYTQFPSFWDKRKQT